MLFLLIRIILSEVIEKCELSKTDEFLITKYYIDKCGPCERVVPFIDEIDTRLERNNHNITIRSVNCSKCGNCLEEGIDKVPSITVHKSGELLGKLVGYAEFGEIVEFIIEHTGWDRNIFKKGIDNIPGKVTKLREKDFMSGFAGPWLILFYKTKSDIKREMMQEIAPNYEEKVKFGEIDGNTIPDVLGKFNVTALPTMVAFYNGLFASYNGTDDKKTVITFVDQLIKPSFEEINLEKFNVIQKHLPSGDPIFIVFYKDLLLANQYFRSTAHEYKFRARIYKSNDKELIEKSGINMEEKEIALIVCRNNTFYQSSYDFTERENIFQWIFQAHYPYVTRINNENFNIIFHGVKPVLLLVTREDDLVQEFESISESMHKGVPFIDKLFAAIDTNTYSLFVPSLLPNIKLPTVVIMDPTHGYFYADKGTVHKENIAEFIENLLSKYGKEQLKVYDGKLPRSNKYIFCIVFVLGVCIFLARYLTKRRSRKSE